MFSVLPLSLLLLCVDAHRCSLVPHSLRNVSPPLSTTSTGTGTSTSTTTSTKVNDGETVTSGASTTSTSPTNSPTSSPFNYDTGVIRAVNLGGWFVLEPWITPSMFENTNNEDIVDEYTFGQLQDYDTAISALTTHWQTWITESDFDAMKDAGLNHVRIPLGYWSVPLSDEDTNTSTSVSPYIPGAWPYFLQALNWARSRSIHTIVDLHGAPGSQNGYDNSGQRTSSPRFGDDQANVERTIDTLQWIVQSVGGLIDVIELLNEPAGYLSGEWASTIRQFWLDGHEAVKNVAGGDTKVMIGDAFLGVQTWTNFLQGQGVLMDDHEYQIFSQLELARSWDEHISFSCSTLPNLQTFDENDMSVVIGEWSNAVTDCARWLNGRGVGARWEGRWHQNNDQVFGTCSNMTGSYSGFSQEYKEFLGRYWEVQVTVAERLHGWVFWTWKAEEADEWSYQKGIEGGWIPRDASERKYPEICP